MESLRNYLWYFSLFLIVFGTGCQTVQPEQPPKQLDPKSTVGSVSKIYFFESIPLRGIGLVAGLPGTGSAECPPRIRRELEKYVWKQLPTDGGISPRQFIASKNTAVVEVYGVIPSLISGQETFDVAVRPLTGTQTTSLQGGHLYTTELKELSRMVNIDQFTAFSKAIATVEGPIYSNPFPSKAAEENEKDWFVLGGARVLETEKITLMLTTPDFFVANVVRNRINERFGDKTAVALSDSQINLFVPSQYQKQKERFLKMVQTLLLTENAEIQSQRIEEMVGRLVTDTNKEAAEISLEAIGRLAGDTLAAHLQSTDLAVQFHAARCMLNIGDDRAIPVLRGILMAPANPYRLETVEAISVSAKQKDIRSTLLIAVNDSDLRVRLAAYEALLRTNSPVVRRKIVAGAFVVDSVACTGPRMIYVFRQQTPRIVLFGAPISCKDDIFIQSANGGITVNARPGDRFVSVARKHPMRPRVVGPVKTGHELSLLLQTLGEVSRTDELSGIRPGLEIPYDEIIAFLKTMCETGAVDATFEAGPPAEVAAPLKDLPPIQN